MTVEVDNLQTTTDYTTLKVSSYCTFSAEFYSFIFNEKLITGIAGRTFSLKKNRNRALVKVEPMRTCDLKNWNMQSSCGHLQIWSITIRIQLSCIAHFQTKSRVPWFECLYVWLKCWCTYPPESTSLYCPLFSFIVSLFLLAFDLALYINETDEWRDDKKELYSQGAVNIRFISQ